jgi:hypothetical protein
MYPHSSGLFAICEMIEYPFHDHRIFDVGDHLDGVAALFTGFDIDLEQASSSKADVEVFAPWKCRVGRDPPMANGIEHRNASFEYGGARLAPYPSGRFWPVAVCAAQQIMYSTLPNPTGSNGFHCGLLKFRRLLHISTTMYRRCRLGRDLPKYVSTVRVYLNSRSSSSTIGQVI